MNARIYVCAHKPENTLLKLTDPMYIPIHCGKAIFKESERTGYLPELGDNTGDNISEKNPYYCELTGMYWAWKNDDSEPDDIIGLNHYRRYFNEPDSGGMKLITKEAIENILNSYDFIVSGPSTDNQYNYVKFGEKTAYENYKECHHQESMDYALTGVKRMFSKIAGRFEYEVKHSGAMCLCNLFITKKKYFDEYSKFLFPILFFVETKIIETKKSLNQYLREFGYLSERLFRPWLIATGHSGKQIGEVNWEDYSGYIWR